MQSWQRMTVNIFLGCKIYIFYNQLFIVLIVIKKIFGILEFHISILTPRQVRSLQALEVHVIVFWAPHSSLSAKGSSLPEAAPELHQ